MKINEINSLNEGIGSALIGAPAAAAIKGMFTGAGGKAQLAQDIFLKDFYGDALTSLKNGISGGIIDPKLTMADAQGSTPAASSAAPAAPASTTPAPAVQKMTPRDMTAARSQNKTVPGTASGTAPPKRMTPRDRLMLQRQAKAVKENTTYDRLNTLFESIIEEQSEGTKSIGEFMLEWFSVYMQGTNWEPYRPKITELCRNIETSYKSGNWKKAIMTLAKAAFSIPGFTGAAGAKNVQVPAASSVPTGDIEKNVKAMYAANPEKVKKAVRDLNIK